MSYEEMQLCPAIVMPGEGDKGGEEILKKDEEKFGCN